MKNFFRMKKKTLKKFFKNFLILDFKFFFWFLKKKITKKRLQKKFKDF